MKMQEAKERIIVNTPLRTAVRFPMKLSVCLTTTAGTLDATTDNISANGILFTGPELPEVNTRIEFKIRLPASVMGTPEDVTVHCIGRIVRHRVQAGESQAAAIIDEYTMRV